MQTHHVQSKLADCLLPLTASIVLLLELVNDMAEVDIDLEVLQETTVSDFLYKGVTRIRFMVRSTRQDLHVGYGLQMTKHRSVKTYL